MRLKNFILGYILIFILLVTISEVTLRFRRGNPPFESYPPGFDHQYVEIHKGFFKKQYLPDGTVVYKIQHSYLDSWHFSAHKDKDTKRIFILGGSVARRFDEHFFKNFLEGLIPNMKFEIINCGIPSYDSYRTLIIHKEILGYNPDLIILLSGNNEYHTPVRVNLWAYRTNRLLRRLWVYRIPQDRIFRDNRMFSIRNRISKESRFANYKNNLKVMTHRAKKRKIPMVVCTLPANFRDCPPTGTPLWHEREYFFAWHAFENEEFEEAIKRFRQFLITHPEDPFGYYYLAQCYDALQDYSQAQQYYIKAMALDANPGDRCPPQRNEAIRQVSLQEGIILTDLEKAFIEISPYGLVGKELFLDNCHWWKEYNHLICNKIIGSLIKYNKAHPKPIFTPLDRWRYDKILIIQDLLKRKEVNSEERTAEVISIIWRALRHYPGNSISERFVSFLNTAYYFNPNLFDDIAFLKEQIFIFRNTHKAYWEGWSEEEVLSNFDKSWVFFLCHAAEAFRRLGLHPKAIEYFNEAINLNPDIWLPYLGRGIAYYKIGQMEKMQRDFEMVGKEYYHHALVEFYGESLGI
ncbi:tetratricopeptide repeat protein [Candidatus Omnitrophota bacterium]